MPALYCYFSYVCLLNCMYYAVCLYSLERFPMLAAPVLWDRAIIDCGFCAKAIKRIQLAFIRLQKPLPVKLWLLKCHDKKSISFMCLLTASVCGLRGLLYLEVVVLVDRAAGVRRHISHGCQVYVLAGEEEEIHTAALCYTVLRQLLIHSFLRLEQGLTGTKQGITFG